MTKDTINNLKKWVKEHPRNRLVFGTDPNSPYGEYMYLYPIKDNGEVNKELGAVFLLLLEEEAYLESCKTIKQVAKPSTQGMALEAIK